MRTQCLYPECKAESRSRGLCKKHRDRVSYLCKSLGFNENNLVKNGRMKPMDRGGRKSNSPEFDAWVKEAA